MTVSELISRVQNRFNDSSIESSVVLQFINDTIRDIQSSGMFPFEYATASLVYTTGENSNDLTAESTPIYIKNGGIMRVYYDAKQPSKLLTYKNLSARDDLDFTTTGAPTYYWMGGDILYIYPKADQNRTIYIDYYKVLDQLTSTSDNIPIPREHQNLIYYGVGRALCEYLEELGTARQSYFEANYINDKRKLLSSLETQGIYDQRNTEDIRTINDIYQLPIQ